jgi:hypothetical protein
MAVRLYAQILGVVLILIGLVGLLLGDGLLLGILNIDVVEDIVHILTGGILAYVGFGWPDIGATRSVAGALGVVYLLVGSLGFILPTLLGLIPRSYSIFDNLLHLALGVLSLVVAVAQGVTTEARS